MINVLRNFMREVNQRPKLRGGKFVFAALLLFLALKSEAQLTIPRGRPQLNAARTTFVADNGQTLRGPFTSTEWTGPVSAQNIAAMKALGFNAVHLYAESFDPNYPTNGSTAPGYSAANVDAIVSATGTNGLYLIITIGNGANNGNYNAAYITNFWKFYAPRYANNTWVLYEIQNEPVAWGPPYSAANATPPGAVNMEKAAYNVIRQYAPNTPVLLFTYAVFGGTGGASAALTDIHAFNTATFGNANAVWTNEAVAFHGYAGWQNTSIAVSNLIKSGYPCMMTEYGGGLWGNIHGCLDAEMTSELERLGVSWLTFQYVPPTGVSDDITQPGVYSNVVVNSGLSWTPDYGGFPSQRSAYGNGGQPRTIPASYANNFLTGVPLRIEAEDFDTGGEGVAYHVTNTVDATIYRPGETVPIKSTTDTGGGYAVTGTSSGEWLEYTIWVQVAGYYNLSLRYAAPSNDCVVQVTGNGNDRTGRWGMPSTGSSTTWVTATRPVLLEPGRQKMRLSILNGGLSLNWFELTPASSGIIPNGVYKFLNAGNASAFTAMTSTNLVAASNYVGSAYQQWNLQHIGGGQYKITAAANGWSWNLNNDGSLGITSGWGTGDHQCFIIKPAGGGFYSVLPVANGLPMETSALNSNAIDQQVYSGSAYQQWAVIPPSAPPFPTGLSASALSSSQVSLSWNPAISATSYNIKRAGNSGGPYTTVATGVTDVNYTDTIPIGMKYYYVVSAVVAGAESADSVEVTYLPYPWQTQDIGSVGFAGNASEDNGVFTVTGSGADIWGTADAFRYVYMPVTGNCTMIARVTSVQNADPWSKGGIMIRESLNANSRQALIAVSPGNGVAFQYRTSAGGGSVNNNTTGFSAPYWVKLVRSGNTFTAYRSPDGAAWTQQGTVTFTMASTAYIGLALTSHNNSSSCTATFDNVSAPGWTVSPPPPAPASLSATVANWNVRLAWPAANGATSYNVKRSLIFGGPYTVIGNVTGTNYTDAAVANGTDYYYVVSALTTGGESTNSVQAGVAAQIFTPSGLSATPVSSNQVSLTWNSFTNATGYNVKSSPNSGGPYTLIASDISTTNYTDTVAAGMKFYYVVSAISDGAETPNSSEATINLPYPWQSQDIGLVGINGSASYGSGVFTASGAGADIQGTGDAFRYVFVPVTGNCTIIARVASVQNINAWSKAGLMIRESLNANAANAFVGVTPGNGITWQYRSSSGGGTTYNNTTGVSAPYWLKLVRSGNVFTGYRSPDGITWTQQGTATFTMASAAYVGLALTSHDSSNLAPATFDNVTTTGWPASAPSPAPTNIIAAATSSSQINLVWNASPAATSYNVKRSAVNGGPYALIASGVSATNYNDTGLPSVNTFYYVISALNPSGESANSTQVSATTSAPNTPPILAPIPNQTIGVGMLLNLTNTATDSDVPAQTLAFNLLVAPANAVINATNGVLSWRPLVAQANTTNLFTVVVADNGAPSLSATQSFLVIVNPLARPQLSPVLLSGGQVVLQISGDRGPDYQIQTSTNLTDWNTVFMTNSPAMPFAWTNSTYGAPMKFFRVQAGP